MAQQHDLLDDIIDISKGLGVLKDPLGTVTNSLLGVATGEGPSWNPQDYRERPRVNALPCLHCIDAASSCNACAAACPVDAVELGDDGVKVTDACKECGLCAAACPTEAMVSPRFQPKKLYDLIAAAATTYETAYVTCTRALGRAPRENEVVVACVGIIKPEVWFALLADFPNVSVYLPLDICTACQNTTGEGLLSESIATAEQWAARGVGLEVDSSALVCKKRREQERKEFIDDIVRTTGLAVGKINPAIAAVASVTQVLKDHSNKILELERTLNAACGVNTQKRRRVLTQSRQLVLSALQDHPRLATSYTGYIPVCDPELCTMCGECVRVCPTKACDLLGSGRVRIEPTYCIGCGLCVEVCEDKALRMEEQDGAELVVPDPEAQKREADAARTRAQAQAAKAKAQGMLNRVLDQVERLDS